MCIIFRFSINFHQNFGWQKGTADVVPWPGIDDMQLLTFFLLSQHAWSWSIINKVHWIPIEVSIQVWDLFACSKTFCEWQVCSVEYKNNKYYGEGDYLQLLTRLRQFRVPWQSNQHTILLLPYTNHHHDHINLLMKWWRYSNYPHQDQILVLMPLPLCFPYLHTLVVMNNLQNT